MTTIAVREETYGLLKHVKQEMHAGTFDETIRNLVLVLKKPRRSMFGSLKGLKEQFQREEIDRFS